MLKRFSLITLVVAFGALTVSCKSKPKVEPPAAQAGEGENGTMDNKVSTEDIDKDAKGSDGGKIAGLSSVRFDYDSSTLTTEARRQLAENAEWIKSHAKTTVQVEGHCDSRGSV